VGEFFISGISYSGIRRRYKDRSEAKRMFEGHRRRTVQPSQPATSRSGCARFGPHFSPIGRASNWPRFNRFRKDAAGAGRADWRQCHRPGSSLSSDPSTHGAQSSWQSNAAGKWNRRGGQSLPALRALFSSECSRASFHADRRMCRRDIPQAQSLIQELRGRLRGAERS